MTKMIFYGLLIYFLYKVIFDIVVPVSNGVKKAKRSMEQMQEAAGASQRADAKGTPTPTSKSPEAPVEAEYIDFEEVKKK